MKLRAKDIVISRAFRIVSDHDADRISHILGEHSAMAKAITDRDERRSKGEDAVILLCRQTILVGPRPKTEK